MSEEQKTLNKKWTDEERLALAAKLDEELDVFIEGLEAKRYEEGWPEDRWQEEMDKHPFFMKNAPQPGDEVHPMFEGLQKLKYDPEENTAEELALNYKEDGNFYMKHRKFRMAICSYTEGLKAKCDNPDINAMLYNNRSAAHFYLSNRRSALNDARSALKLKPGYIKPRWRAAQCAFALNMFDLCQKMCEEILERDKNNKKVLTLLKENKKQQLKWDRDERKENFRMNALTAKHIELVETLEARGVKFERNKKRAPISADLLEPVYMALSNCSVHLDRCDNTTLIWPMAFMYPEFSISDYLVDVPEDCSMEYCLARIFVTPLPCDKRAAYKLDTVNVYYEDYTTGQIHPVDTKKTISEITVEKNFYVTNAALVFYVLIKNSKEEKEFLSEYREPFESKWVRVD